MLEDAAAHRFGRDVLQEVRRHAQAHLGFDVAAYRVQLVARTQHLVQHGLRVRKKRLAVLRERHAARPALEQLHAELALELVDGARQGWLADAEELRRLADAAALRHRDKVLEPVGVHGPR